MSPRRIFFNSRELHWECSCSVWHEELVLGAEVEKYIDDRLKIILAGFPDLRSLSNPIGFYNEMTLRYEEDALPGTTGLLSVLSRSFTGGFLYGLPIMGHWVGHQHGRTPTSIVVLHPTGLQRIA